MLKFFVIIFILVNLIAFDSLFSTQNNFSLQKTDEYDQWFTGAIFTPLSITVDPKHPGLEVVLFSLKTYGQYNSSGRLINISTITSLSPYADFQFSINKVIGFEIISSFARNYCDKEYSTHLQDTYVRCGLQVSNDQEGTWIPDFRILIHETIPTGKYQNLDPKKNDCDLTGQGSYQTGIYFTFQKLFRAKSEHNFAIRSCIGYFISTPVKVKGLNYYGGEANSLGVVYPGNFLSYFLFGEYALNRKWALACELFYLKGWKGSFSKKRGEDIDVPAYNQLSLSPQVQYTFTRDFGLIIGSWVSLAGKNSSAFSSFFVSGLYIF